MRHATSQDRPRIAIVGAGMGGLTLARVLHVNGVNSVVYEGDSSAQDRTQGGSLDLHTESGQRALREAGLEDGFLRLARPEGQAIRIVDPQGTVLVDHQPAPNADPASAARPEVDRGALRTLLLDSLPDGTVRWGHRLSEVVPTGRGGFSLSFENGVGENCELLVGADGARSRVRRLLTDAWPAYTGSSSVELGIPDAERRHPELAARVGLGSYWAMGDAQTVSTQRQADDRLGIYLVRRAPEEWSRTGIPTDPDQARESVAALLDGWDPALQAMVRACDDTVVVRRIDALPVGLTWPGTPGATVLGDAAHLMPPVGEGANQAMLDGLLLGQAVAAAVSSGGDLTAAVRGYEREMFARTAPLAQRSADMSELFVSPEGRAAMVRFFGGVPA